MAVVDNSGRQYQERNTWAFNAQAPLAEARLVGRDGMYATSAGGLKMVVGATKFAAATGEACTAITGYSALVESSAVLGYGDWVRPAADGSGRLELGSATNHCGWVLQAAAVGSVVETVLLPHRLT
jgi:hypothetical protein